MVFYNMGIKPIRFDPNPLFAVSPIVEMYRKIHCTEEVGVNKGHLWIGVMWRVYLLQTGTNTEILGMLIQHRPSVQAQSKEIDLKDVERFVLASFYKVCKYYELKRPEHLKTISCDPLSDEDHKSISNNLFQRVVGLGIYQK